MDFSSSLRRIYTNTVQLRIIVATVLKVKRCPWQRLKPYRKKKVEQVGASGKNPKGSLKTFSG
jgi:hypothetical protein